MCIRIQVVVLRLIEEYHFGRARRAAAASARLVLRQIHRAVSDPENIDAFLMFSLQLGEPPGSRSRSWVRD